MWAQDWLRRVRSVNIFSVEPTGRNDAAIADQRSTLNDADLTIVTRDDENDFVVISNADHHNQPNDSTNASHIEIFSIGASFAKDAQQLLKHGEEASISQSNAYSMNLCGRGDHHHTFHDLRSASQATKRDRSTRQKYYNFRYVKGLVILELCITSQLMCLT